MHLHQSCKIENTYVNVCSVYSRLKADVVLSTLKTIVDDLDFSSLVNRCEKTRKVLKDAWNEPENSCK